MHHYSPRDPLAEYFRGEITLRKLRVMVEGLGPNGALARAATGHTWTQETYALVDMRDLLADHFVAFLNAHRPEERSPLPYPERSWRPGDPSPEQKAKRDAKKAAAAREGYLDIAAQVTPTQ
ncbi:hypothetical protein [Streptomyces enissocaesilis]|uniref:Uncharacterized protein n=1 Tax=Streptomyces enissocaesilis TaxID=332589 RepID=A0ABP6K7F9_9ACTN